MTDELAISLVEEPGFTKKDEKKNEKSYYETFREVNNKRCMKEINFQLTLSRRQKDQILQYDDLLYTGVTRKTGFFDDFVGFQSEQLTYIILLLIHGWCRCHNLAFRTNRSNENFERTLNWVICR